MSEDLALRQLDNNLVSFCAGRIEQGHQKRLAGSLGVVANVGSVGSVVFLIFGRPHVAVGATDEASQNVRTLCVISKTEGEAAEAKQT